MSAMSRELGGRAQLPVATTFGQAFEQEMELRGLRSHSFDTLQNFRAAASEANRRILEFDLAALQRELAGLQSRTDPELLAGLEERAVRLEEERDQARADAASCREQLRELAHVPAVRQVLGENHTPGCDCPWCKALQVLGEK